jgi:hypothetical protein
MLWSQAKVLWVEKQARRFVTLKITPREQVQLRLLALTLALVCSHSAVSVTPHFSTHSTYA